MYKIASSGKSLNILEGRTHLELSYLAQYCTGIVVTLSYVACPGQDDYCTAGDEHHEN
jgi:hypothetical protein